MHLAPTPPYTVTEFRVSDGPQRNHSTLATMREFIELGKVDPMILQAAHSILWHSPERDEFGEVSALFDYVRDYIRYVRDPVGVEAVASPAMTLQRRIGDCDDQTTLLCALLESCGYPTRLVMGQFSADDYEHVWCQVFACGYWLDCDPIERTAEVGYAPPDPVRLFIEAR